MLKDPNAEQNSDHNAEVPECLVFWMPNPTTWGSNVILNAKQYWIHLMPAGHVCVLWEIIWN